MLPTTDQVQILRYGEKKSTTVESDNVTSIRLPVEWLKDMNMVDTPGTNAIFTEHQSITERFLPHSDIVFFITSLDKPFSESERVFLANISKWRKKVVIVINKIDNASNAEDLRSIVDFVRTNVKQVLHEDPVIFPVSARQALKLKLKHAVEKVAVPVPVTAASSATSSSPSSSLSQSAFVAKTAAGTTVAATAEVPSAES